MSPRLFDYNVLSQLLNVEYISEISLSSWPVVCKLEVNVIS